MYNYCDITYHMHYNDVTWENWSGSGGDVVRWGKMECRCHGLGVLAVCNWCGVGVSV